MKRVHLLICLVVLLMSVSLALRSSKTPDPTKTYLVTSVRSVPVSVRPLGMSSKQGFDEPLRLGESLAVRRGTNWGIITLRAVSSDKVTCEVECGGSIPVVDTFGDETVGLCGMRLRWSSKDSQSIYIYEDSARRLSGTNCYEVAYPLRPEHYKANRLDLDSLQWLRSP